MPAVNSFPKPPLLSPTANPPFVTKKYGGYTLLNNTPDISKPGLMPMRSFPDINYGHSNLRLSFLVWNKVQQDQNTCTCSLLFSFSCF